MKVVGTGAPRTLTVRLQPCEFGVWRDELRRRLTAASHRVPCAGGIPEHDRLDREDEVVLLSRLLDGAHAEVAEGQPRILSGPTWLLGDVIRAVAAHAMERYVVAGAAFCEGRSTPTADQLRAALDTATACTATAIGLARAETDADDFATR